MRERKAVNQRRTWMRCRLRYSTMATYQGADIFYTGLRQSCVSLRSTGIRGR
uniref:Uncharacterized protein n=1 Tax=Mesocestoides corti TaxID=53468 RepID=A0A5K3EYE3_MESCO